MAGEDDTAGRFVLDLTNPGESVEAENMPVTPSLPLGNSIFSPNALQQSFPGEHEVFFDNGDCDTRENGRVYLDDMALRMLRREGLLSPRFGRPGGDIGIEGGFAESWRSRDREDSDNEPPPAPGCGESCKDTFRDGLTPDDFVGDIHSLPTPVPPPTVAPPPPTVAAPPPIVPPAEVPEKEPVCQDLILSQLPGLGGVTVALEGATNTGLPRSSEPRTLTYGA